MYGTLRVVFFCTSENLYVYIKPEIQPIKGTPNFHVIGGNPNAGFGIVGFLLYTQSVAPKDDYHKKTMSSFAFTLVEYI